MQFLCRTQDMTGLKKSAPNPRNGLKWAPVAPGRELVQYLLDIFLVVEGVKKRQTFAFVNLIDEFEIFPLDIRGITEHVGTEVVGGMRAMNLTGEPSRFDSWEVTAVIDMRMGKDDRLDPVSWIARVAVTVVGFFAPPLEKPTFKQELVPLDFKEVL